ncbi:MAG: sigma-70 family RNA polymerase sigma factor [Sedimentisphaerales bacterium]|nr:sigma-70 family RNA polymerase sigma factor [Sedimentisphaerales bacterium]
MNEVTRIINAIEQGDPHASEELLPLVYEELRFLATQKMALEKPGQTLQATALVHEAYIRLVEESQQSWDNRGHFFKAASEAMRRILIDNARRKKSLKRGGGHERIDLCGVVLAGNTDISLDDLMSLDEAIEKLANKDRIKAELVKLRYFAGLTSEQAAEVLGISHNTADKYWAYARAWLRVEIKADDGASKE